MFEIGLIITLLISISGMINGISGQFVTLLTQSNSNKASYLMIQKNATLETSKIPVDVIKQLDTSYFNYYTPMVYKTVLDNNNETLSYVYLNYTNVMTLKSDFALKEGTISNKTGDILIGEGLQQQLFKNLIVPDTIEVQVGSKKVNKTITGVFTDNSFYDYALVDNINTIWSNLSSVSLFQFQIKNDKVFSDFQALVNNIIHNTDPGLELSISPLKKSNDLSEAFYIDIYNLFFYLQIIMLVLLALKITHASFTLYNRFYKDFIILRILGTSNIKLQIEFFIILGIIGNLGVLYGLIAGIALPHVFLLLIRAFVQYQGLYIIVPNMTDILLLFLLTNCFLILNSFWVVKLQVKDKLVTQN